MPSRSTASDPDGLANEYDRGPAGGPLAVDEQDLFENRVDYVYTPSDHGSPFIFKFTWLQSGNPPLNHHVNFSVLVFFDPGPAIYHWRYCITDITPSPNQSACHDTSLSWTYGSEVWWGGETGNSHDAMGVNGASAPSVSISSMQYHIQGTAWTSSEVGSTGTSCGGIVGSGSYNHCKWETTTALDVYTDDH